MKNTAIAARIVLGLVFLIAGVSGLLIINNPPPMPPGLVATFMSVFFQSRWARRRVCCSFTTAIFRK